MLTSLATWSSALSRGKYLLRAATAQSYKSDLCSSSAASLLVKSKIVNKFYHLGIVSRALPKVSEAHKTLEDVSDANEFWEAQDGFSPQENPVKPTETKTFKTPKRAYRETIHSDATVPVRNSSIASGPRPRSLRKRVRDYDDSERDEDFVWREDFERMFGGKKMASEVKSEESNYFGSSPDFDVKHFRGQVEHIKRSLWKALKVGDADDASRQFEFLVRLQRRIPNEFNRLHTICKPCWMAHLEVIIRHGEYEKLQFYMDKLQATYGLHQEDRVLMTLRFFYEHNMPSVAENFWSDAKNADLLDERAYADMADWLQKKGLFEDSKKIVHAALIRSQENPSFSLTIYFFHACISIAIKTADIPFLTETVELLKNSSPQGVRTESFVTWLQAINNLIYGPNMMDSLGQHSGETPETAYKSYLEIQHQMFNIVSGAIANFPITSTGQIRQEQMRHEIIQVATISEQVEIFKRYGDGALLFAINCMVDSLVVHQNLEGLYTLLKKPSKFFGKRSNGSSLRLPPTTFNAVAAWIDRFILHPTSCFPTVAIPSVIPPRPTHEHSGVTTHPIEASNSTAGGIQETESQQPVLSSACLGSKSMAILLYDICFFRQLPPSKTTADLILHIIHTAWPKKIPVGRILRGKVKMALAPILDRIYQAQYLAIPDDAEIQSRIFEEMARLGLDDEVTQLSEFCMSRVSPSTVVPIMAALMTHKIELKDWEEVDKIWNRAQQKKVSYKSEVARVYARSLAARNPVDPLRCFEFVASVLKREIPLSANMHAYIIRMIYKLTHVVGLDVASFRAIDTLRRQRHIVLTTDTASLLATIICQAGDAYIRNEANARLHSDFDAFISQDITQPGESLEVEESKAFQDLMDQWFPMLLRVVPNPTHSISGYIHKQSQLSSGQKVAPL